MTAVPDVPVDTGYKADMRGKARRFVSASEGEVDGCPGVRCAKYCCADPVLMREIVFTMPFGDKGVSLGLLW